MKQQVFYIHGGESFDSRAVFIEHLQTKDIWDLPWIESKGKWTKSLAADLGDGYEVFMPLMPNKNNASYEEWKIWFERHFQYLNDGLILMGCSLGAMFLSKYLAEHDTPFTIKALVLMAGYVGAAPSDGDVGSFLVQETLLPQLSGKAEKIIIMHSTDDFVVPYEHALKYKKALPEAELVTFSDKNHFLVEELPELVEGIRAVT